MTKTKATYRLPDDLLNRIEDLYLELRRERRGQPPVDKALIVATALHLGLQDRRLKKALAVHAGEE